MIREIFPQAYKLAVTRTFEDLAGKDAQAELKTRRYIGLWKAVRTPLHKP